MLRPELEVADIFRLHGEAWRAANAGHLSLDQRRVMSAIEICRTASLGGHVEQCEDCAHTRIAYNSCRNRSCPKCQWPAAAAWLAARAAELLPVRYFHVVFTLPPVIGAIAFQNKTKVYGLLFKAAAETLTTLAADPKYLGADLGVIAVLHTWGENLQHHPHLHSIVSGGGISPNGKRWIACAPEFLPRDAVSTLFRRLFLKGLTAAFDAGELQFFTDLVGLNEAKTFAAALAPLHTAEWGVYAKEPFAGPKQVLAYLARYTHRVAITNSRLVDLDATHVSFRWKDYREGDHSNEVMRLEIGEFIRRFLLHVLPSGFHRIRHYGFLANGQRAGKLTLCRSLLGVPTPLMHRNNEHQEQEKNSAITKDEDEIPPCPCCGGRMKFMSTFEGPFSRPFHVRKLDGL
jgi:hypothetical protein